VILNIIIKSLFLDATPFWYDEMISVKDTQLDFGHVKHESEWDNNPPFYYYCLWVWHAIIPVSEFNTRFLGVLFISFAIGLTYLFANKYFNNKIAIATAVLLSLSNFIFFYSQEARAYSLILLLSIISAFQFFKYLNNSTILNLIILSLVNFLIIYTHYISGLIVFVQYLMILFFYRKKYLSFFGIQSLIIVGLILLRFTKKQFLNIVNFNKKDDFWLKPAKLEDLIHSFSELFYNNLTAIVFLAVLLVYAYLYFSKKSEDKERVKSYCLFLGFFSIFFLFAIGVFKPIFLSRYLIFCIPFATMLVVHQLFRFNKTGIIIIFTLIAFETYSITLVKRPSSDYRSLAKVVNKHKKTNDIVIINTRDNLGLYIYYAYDHFLNAKAFDSLCKVNNIYALNDTLALNGIDYSGSSNIFLIQSFHDIMDTTNPVKKFFKKRNKKVFSTKFYNVIEFTVFKSR
jgi:mannosyltransferase